MEASMVVVELVDMKSAVREETVMLDSVSLKSSRDQPNMKIGAHIENGAIKNLSQWYGELPPDVVDVTSADPPAKIGDKVVKGKVLAAKPESISQALKLRLALAQVEYNDFGLNELNALIRLYQFADGEGYVLNGNGGVVLVDKKSAGDIIENLVSQEQAVLKKYA
jgi:hypothetical protein